MATGGGGELERIGLLASLVQDGEATPEEARELEGLLRLHPEAREFVADVQEGGAAWSALARSGRLPEGFAARAARLATATRFPAGRLFAIGSGLLAAAASVAICAGLRAPPGTPETPVGPRPTGDIARPAPAGPPPAPEPAPPVLPTPVERDAVPQDPAPAPLPAAPRDAAVEQPAPPVSTAPGPVLPDLLDDGPDGPRPGGGDAPLVESPSRSTLPDAHAPSEASGVPARLPLAEGPAGEIAAGEEVSAAERPVEIALRPAGHPVGYVVLARGARVRLESGGGREVRIALVEGAVFVEVEPRGPACRVVTAGGEVACPPGGRAEVALEPGALVVLPADGEVEVRGREDAATVRVARGASIRVARSGRAGAAAAARPRVPDYARGAVAARFARAYDAHAPGRAGWAGERARVLKQAGVLLDAGVAPRRLQALGSRVAERGFGASDLAGVYRAYEAGLAVGRSPEEVSGAIEEMFAAEASGPALLSALERWIREGSRPPRRDRGDAPGGGAGPRRPPRTGR